MHDIPDSLTDNTSGGKNLIFFKETIRIVFLLGGTKKKVADLANLLEATKQVFLHLSLVSSLLITLASLLQISLTSFITDKPSSFIADKES